jgi:uncharacterized protein involved in exopolysaccharide biosynthesis
MTEQATPIPADDEIDLLDLLVTIAESWKLLLFVPLLVGVMAATIATYFKPIYQSSAIVRLAEEEVAVLHSAAVLDPLLEPFAYRQKAKGVVEDARQALKQDLTYNTDKRTKLVTISAKAASPELAQQLNTRAIALLLDELTPKGLTKFQIEQSIADRENAIIATEQSSAKLLEAFLKNNVDAYMVDQAVTSISNSANFILSNRQEVHALKARLLPKGAELFVQPPTLPQRSLPRKTPMIGISAMVGTGFVLILFVFLRKAFKNAALNPDSANKITRIRQAFHLKAQA